MTRIIKKAIQSDVRDRYSSARNLLNELRNQGQEQAIKSTCALIADSGEQLYLPYGKHIIGRKDIAPNNYYISEKQFEIDFDGINARMRDMANKNNILLNGAKINDNWFDIANRSRVRIANLNFEIDLQ